MYIFMYNPFASMEVQKMHLNVQLGSTVASPPCTCQCTCRLYIQLYNQVVHPGCTTKFQAVVQWHVQPLRAIYVHFMYNVLIIGSTTSLNTQMWGRITWSVGLSWKTYSHRSSIAHCGRYLRSYHGLGIPRFCTDI